MTRSVGLARLVPSNSPQSVVRPAREASQGGWRIGAHRILTLGGPVNPVTALVVVILVVVLLKLLGLL